MTISRRNLMLTLPSAAIAGVVVGDIANSADGAAQDAHEKELGETLQAAHKRLIGKWKSDVKKSMEFNNKFVKLKKKQRQFLNNFLGNMTIEFDGETNTMQMPALEFEKSNGELFAEEGWDESDAYNVVGFDSVDDAVVVTSTFLDFDTVSTIYFEDEWIWMYSAFGHIREYFKRVK